ncbi:MAG: type I restriction endonuclease [Rhodothermales bacterium]
MTVSTNEAALESAIERMLVHGTALGGTVGEPRLEYGEFGSPGGFEKRTQADYDINRSLIQDDLISFVQGTQPKEWAKYKQHHAESARTKFCQRVAREIDRRGAVEVLRKGVKDTGCHFHLAYFPPASALNEELQNLYAANIFAVIRQLHYSIKNKNHSLDLVLFLNGIPLFTAELKNAITGQTVKDAMRQYREDRDPKEPLFAFGRCLGHFAVDTDLAYVTTRLDGVRTRFLPFNRGYALGAGNPPSKTSYSTAYLWESIWTKRSILNLIRHFIHRVELFDENGKKTKQHALIFPRYQQLDAVRTLVADAKKHGAGKRYLIQHSAGSGKSNTIAWLAHQLSTLHGIDDKRVFDSIIVVTDRRVLDRQLQQTIQQFEQTLGIVQNIDKTSSQLGKALEDGKTIIVTTLQKFGVIVNAIGELKGKRFAVIVDEAHSSQSGESAKSLKKVLVKDGIAEEELEEDEVDNAVLKEIAARGRQDNLSTFAFTATPKPKTLELFGVRQPDGRFSAFHLYSMKQAIEEGFILDVLRNYTTYTAYWRLLKTVEDDPRYDTGKATYLLKNFVELHEEAIRQKVGIMVDHYASHVKHRIAGKAKAMIVTRSRLHAVRYKLAIDAYIQEKGYSFKTLVAFSDKVDDGGKTYTEAGMNGFSDTQTAKTFNQDAYRIMVVANKFQTGFDQPLLHTMYVDKKLGGVGAVQTLSRLNRTHPDKVDTMVIDFANEAEDIQKAFADYFETTILTEGTDPNLIYDVEARLEEHGVYERAEIEQVAGYVFGKKRVDSSKVYAVVGKAVARYKMLEDEEQKAFKSQLSEYIRLYSFLAQVMPFKDISLEKLFVFARFLRPLIAGDKEVLPVEVTSNVDMGTYRLHETFSGATSVEQGEGALQPQGAKEHHVSPAADEEPLSQIIKLLNDRFGLKLGPEHEETIGKVLTTLDGDASLGTIVQANTRDNAKLSFDHKAEDVLQDIVDTNYELYKLITNNDKAGRVLKDFLFDQFASKHRRAADLVKKHESKTLEFKSTLRWDVKLGQNNPKVVTHAVLKTLAAFMNTDGGDLLIGVDDSGKVLGLDADGFDSEDAFMLHLTEQTRNALGDLAATLIDPAMQNVGARRVCLVSCKRSSVPIYLKWKGTEKDEERGDFYVRQGQGPGTVLLQ